MGKSEAKRMTSAHPDGRACGGRAMTVQPDVIQIIKPEFDSQFRLVPCPECKSNDVAYEAYKKGGEEPWRVRCFGCGHVVDKQAACRHDAQLFWNRGVVA